MKRNTKVKEETVAEVEVVEDKPTGTAMAGFFGGGAVANVEDMQQALGAVGQASRNVGGGLYLRFTKQGEWLFGQNLDEVEGTDRFAVNPMSFTNGWIGWLNGSVVEERMCSVAQGMPCMEADLPAIDSTKDSDGWSAQLGIQMMSTDPEEPLELKFHVTSRGGKQAISGLADAISVRLSTNPDSPVPIVQLSGDSYKHKSYGMIHTPVISITAWADMNGNVAEEVAAAA